jgi:hypothetical protein
MPIAQPSINGVPIPAGIYNAGEYMFYPQEQIVTGSGATVAVGTQSAVWRFEIVSAAQLNWWKWVALASASYRSTSFSLWIDNDRETLFSFTSGIIYAPSMAEVQPLPKQRYGPLEIRFDYLLPIYVDPTVFIIGTSLLGGVHVMVGEVGST